MAYPVRCNDRVVEAGWSTLKTEFLPENAPFASLEEARLEIAWYLDVYFNLDRRHSTLGYRSPHPFGHDRKINRPSFTVRFYWTAPDHPPNTRSRNTSYFRG